MLDLSIIIVSYNAKEFLRKCIASIVKNIKNVSYEVIVVDNNSTDSSSEMVKKEFPQIKLIADTIVNEQSVEGMVKFMDSHSDAGASTCKLVMPNGRIDDASHRGFPTPWNSFCHFSGMSRIFPKSQIFAGYNLGWMNFEKTHEIDVLAGAFMLVRRVAGKEAKWWDEDYFFYGEDIDFCYQLKAKGWKIYYVPTFSIIHYKGVSGGIKSVSKEITTARKETKEMVTKWRFKAMRIFYNKHYRQKYPWIITLLVNVGISIREKI